MDADRVGIIYCMRVGVLLTYKQVARYKAIIRPLGTWAANLQMMAPTSSRDHVFLPRNLSDTRCKKQQVAARRKKLGRYVGPAPT